MYSLAALPSITRAAPAKKRRLSTITGISSIAAPTGLPAFRLSSRPSSSARASIASASLSRARLRSWGVVCCHVSNALAAALTTRSTSSGPDAWTWPITWPLAGFSTARVWPPALSTQAPPMNCWRVVVFSRVSVTSWGPPGGLADGARRWARARGWARVFLSCWHCAPAGEGRSAPRTGAAAQARTGCPSRASRSTRSAARNVPGCAWRRAATAASRARRAASASSRSIAPVSSADSKA